MDELKNIAPELSKIKKETPFRPPKHYFDDFPAHMQMRLTDEQQKKPTKKRFIQIVKPVLGLVASFAIILLLVKIPMKIYDKKNTEQASLSTSEQGNTTFTDLIKQIDELSFISALYDDSETNNDFSEEELTLYVSTNFNNYEIYKNLDN
mgnify:CR=1 FL=1